MDDITDEDLLLALDVEGEEVELFGVADAPRQEAPAHDDAQASFQATSVPLATPQPPSAAAAAAATPRPVSNATLAVSLAAMGARRASTSGAGGVASLSSVDAVTNALQSHLAPSHLPAPDLSASDGAEELSGLRIRNRLVSASELRTALRTRTVHKLSELASVPLPRPPAGTDRVTVDWLTIGVLCEKSAPRENKRGGRFGMWTLTNYAACITLFLFGEAYDAHRAEVEGSILLVACPSIFAASGRKSFSMSVSAANQITKLGTSPVLAYCEAIKKDGSKCGMAINGSNSKTCVHHSSSEYRKTLKEAQALRAEVSSLGLRIVPAYSDGRPAATPAMVAAMNGSVQVRDGKTMGLIRDVAASLHRNISEGSYSAGVASALAVEAARGQANASSNNHAHAPAGSATSMPSRASAAPPVRAGSSASATAKASAALEAVMNAEARGFVLSSSSAMQVCAFATRASSDASRSSNMGGGSGAEVGKLPEKDRVRMVATALQSVDNAAAAGSKGFTGGSRQLCAAAGVSPTVVAAKATTAKSSEPLRPEVLESLRAAIMTGSMFDTQGVRASSSALVIPPRPATSSTHRVAELARSVGDRIHSHAPVARSGDDRVTSAPAGVSVVTVGMKRARDLAASVLEAEAAAAAATKRVAAAHGVTSRAVDLFSAVLDSPPPASSKSGDIETRFARRPEQAAIFSRPPASRNLSDLQPGADASAGPVLSYDERVRLERLQGTQLVREQVRATAQAKAAGLLNSPDPTKSSPTKAPGTRALLESGCMRVVSRTATAGGSSETEGSGSASGGLTTAEMRAMVSGGGSMCADDARAERMAIVAALLEKGEKLDAMEEKMRAVTSRKATRYFCTACCKWFDKDPEMCRREGHSIEHHVRDQYALECKKCHTKTSSFQKTCSKTCARCGSCDWAPTSIYTVQKYHDRLDDRDAVHARATQVENSLRFGGTVSYGFTGE